MYIKYRNRYGQFSTVPAVEGYANLGLSDPNEELLESYGVSQSDIDPCYLEGDGENKDGRPHLFVFKIGDRQVPYVLNSSQIYLVSDENGQTLDWLHK